MCVCVCIDTAKETINKMKSPPIEWKIIFANNVSVKGGNNPKYTKNSYNSTFKKKPQVKNRQRI